MNDQFFDRVMIVNIQKRAEFVGRLQPDPCLDGNGGNVGGKNLGEKTRLVPAVSQETRTFPFCGDRSRRTAQIEIDLSYPSVASSFAARMKSAARFVSSCGTSGTPSVARRDQIPQFARSKTDGSAWVARNGA
jgi:hypothetical protein